MSRIEQRSKTNLCAGKEPFKVEASNAGKPSVLRDTIANADILQNRCCRKVPDSSGKAHSDRVPNVRRRYLKRCTAEFLAFPSNLTFFAGWHFRRPKTEARRSCQSST